MAKIYETEADLERDVLKDQATRLRLEQARTRDWGTTWFAAGLLTDMLTRGRGVLSWVGMGLQMIGVMDWIQAWNTGSKARDAELELERKGPEQVAVLIPQDDTPALPEEDCRTCKKTLTRPELLRKSLLARAEKNTTTDIAPHH